MMLKLKSLRKYDMKSVNWADEAGFTYMDITEYTVKQIDTVKLPILFLIRQ